MKKLVLLLLVAAMPVSAQLFPGQDDNDQSRKPAYGFDYRDDPYNEDDQAYTKWQDCHTILFAAHGTRCYVVTDTSVAAWRRQLMSNGTYAWILVYSEQLGDGVEVQGLFRPAPQGYAGIPEHYLGTISVHYYAITRTLPQMCLSHFNEC